MAQPRNLIAPQWAQLKQFSVDPLDLVYMTQEELSARRLIPEPASLLPIIKHDLATLQRQRTFLITQMKLLRDNVQQAEQQYFLLGLPSIVDRPSMQLRWRERSIGLRRRENAPARPSWISWPNWPRALAAKNMAQEWRDWFVLNSNVAMTLNFYLRLNSVLHKELAAHGDVLGEQTVAS